MRLPRLLLLPLAAAALTITSASAPAVVLSAPPAWDAKVDPWVLSTAGAGPTEFLVFLTEQADVSAARRPGGQGGEGALRVRTRLRDDRGAHAGSAARVPVRPGRGAPRVLGGEHDLGARRPRARRGAGAA